MKFPFAFSTVLVLAKAAATPGTVSRDAGKINIIPVPEGFLESHIGETGITLVSADTQTLASHAITHCYVCIDANFQSACQNLKVNTGIILSATRMML
ncbi:uncharacterized protein PAC_06593 [Phialocephala subalpina]|uniref:Uncharacterized protein n=1 Tax=Phialocephala subalpina TaxID=576137 RepID=A0A1L7WV91_9HELO|nr:uncharacterized protein PAC_06593 [Phialocephala subalpina]